MANTPFLWKGAVEPGSVAPTKTTVTNLCLQSEDFLTTWAETNAASVADQANAPDGVLSADQLLDDSSTGTGAVRVQQTLTTATSTIYCWSAYMKADQLSWGQLRIAGMASQTLNVFYNLSAGTVGTASVDVVGSGIVDEGNGWYRCWFTFTSDGADTSADYQIRPADADADAQVDLDGTSSIFAWGAQLEAGTSPGTYVKTLTTAVTKVFGGNEVKAWKGAVEPVGAAAASATERLVGGVTRGVTRGITRGVTEDWTWS